VLVHMGHEIEYEEISKILPKNVIAAYDNMKI
jgi:phosphoribosyl 1,2-cyclic phosphodiesterase